MIELKSAGKTYDRAAGPALSDVTLTVQAGEIFGVIGASGAGKSTLIRLINLLERPTTGQVLVDGQDITGLSPTELRQARRRIGMIFQHFNLLSSKTVAQNIAFPLRLAGTPAGQIKSRVAALLDRVGLSGHAGKYPAQLSGGQKQRVGIARALACEPKVLLCDEATSALDPETTESILALIAELNREFGLTVVLITHEMDVIRRICDRVAILDAGHIVETGDVADVFLHPKHPAARALLNDSEPETDAAIADARAAGETVLRLTFRGAAAQAPVLGQVARDTGVDYRILAGRAGRIGDGAYAQLTVSLTGGDPARARQGFTTAGVIVEEIAP